MPYNGAYECSSDACRASRMVCILLLQTASQIQTWCNDQIGRRSWRLNAWGSRDGERNLGLRFLDIWFHNHYWLLNDIEVTKSDRSAVSYIGVLIHDRQYNLIQYQLTWRFRDQVIGMGHANYLSLSLLDIGAFEWIWVLIHLHLNLSRELVWNL